MGDAAAGAERGGTRRWVVNHKRVHRIYREEGLAVRRKQAQTAAGRGASASGAADSCQSGLDHGLHQGPLGEREGGSGR